jgi:hypothetical protein
MGTRNLTAVFMDGEYVVAQYGQWDGYPEGQGATCLNFLRDEMDESIFREQLKKIHFGDEKELGDLFSEFGASQSGSFSMQNYDLFKKAYPELHRDTGAGILKMIQDGKVRILRDDIDFAADGLFCEWAYVIDLDKRRFEVYTGFHKEPLTEKDRFYFLKDKEENGYSGIHMVFSWSIDDLPTDEEFIRTFVADD